MRPLPTWSSSARLRRLAATAALLLPLLFISPAAGAVSVDSLVGELCKYQVLDSDTCSSKVVISCLVQSGGSTAGMQKCAADHDPKARKFIDIYTAATKPDYVRLLELAGPLVACKLLPPGPPSDILCSTALRPVIEKAFDKAAKIYDAASRGEWLTLIYVVGDVSLACDLVPGFPGKDVICGPIAQIFAEGAKLLKLGIGAGVDAMEGGVEALGSLAGAALKSLGLGQAGVAPEQIFYQQSARPWLHQRVLKSLTGNKIQGHLGFDDALMKQCIASVDMSLNKTGQQAAANACKHKSQQLHNEATGIANLARVAPAAYFENIRATAALLVATNFMSDRVDNFITRIRQMPPAQWTTQGFQSLPQPFAATMVSCLENNKSRFPVPLAPQVTGPLKPPSLWGWICHGAGVSLSWAVAGEKQRIINRVMPQLTGVGCVIAKSGDRSLKFECSSGAALEMCHGLFADANPTSRCLRSAQAPLQRARPEMLQRSDVVEAAAAAMVRERVPARPAPFAAERLLRSSVPATGASFEAEALLQSGAVRVAGGRADAQPMAAFGRTWSGGSQLFWYDTSVGATLDLMVTVPADGLWVVEIDLTQAPDYGQLAFEVDQHPVPERFDGFARRVEGPVTVTLGAFAMQKGQRPVSLKVIGRNGYSTGTLVGIDRIRISPRGS